MDDELANRFDRFCESEGIDNQSKGLCKAIDEGLRSMGYQPAYVDRSARWLALARGIGSVFGLAALALFGLGAILSPVFSRYGFGLSVASIAFFAGAEIADRHGPELIRWAKRAARNEAKQWTASESGEQ